MKPKEEIKLLKGTVASLEKTIAEQDELIAMLRDKTKDAVASSGTGLPVVKIDKVNYTCKPSFTLGAETFRASDMTEELGRRILAMEGQRILRAVK